MGVGGAFDTVPSGTVTFLFTDVEDSTPWWAEDRDGMSASLRVHDGIVRDAISRRGGYVFTTAGDSFAAAFTRASDAVGAAIDAQSALAAAVWPGPALRVRMGMHVGEAEVRDGDYFGPAVNLAARVEAAGHGGQVLVTDAVRVVAGLDAVVDVGMHVLRGVPEPVRLFQVGDGVFPPLRVPVTTVSNLPTVPTRIIGRHEDGARVRAALAACRWVTLTAVGGSGKTRLAVAVGEAELPERSDGVWFADLSTVVEPSDVPAAIAKAVGLTLAEGDAVSQVVDHLADKDALVIVDNCEHVTDACAHFAQRFLGAPGRSVVLATSRESLDVDGEQVVHVGSLTADGPGAPAIQLFAERAAAVDEAFVVTDDNVATIGELCRHLDGLPLAIELAAARVVVMTPAELLDGLHDRFTLLSGGRRRHRWSTLQAMLDWSYDLLDGREQRTLRALSVFIDGFDVDAVAAVAELSRSDALRELEALVAKSFVVRTRRGHRTRFALLETVRAYVERLSSDAGEATDARDRHLVHFHGLAASRRCDGLSDIRLGIALRAERSNLTAAYERAMATGRYAMASEVITGAYAAYLLDGGAIEARALLERALARCHEEDARDEARVGLLMTVAWLSDWATFQDVAAQLIGSRRGVLRSIGFLAAALMAAYAGEGMSAELLAQARATLDAETGSDADALATIAAGLLSWVAARIAADEGDLVAGERGTMAFLDALEAVDRYPTTTPRATKHAAVCQLLLGERRRAIETVAWLERLDESTFLCDDIRALAALGEDELDTARRLIASHADRGLTGRMPGEVCDSAVLLAALAHHEGDDDTARTLLAHMGAGLEPAVLVYSRHLAAELGVAAEHETRQAAALAYRSTDPQGLNGSRSAARAVRHELERRARHPAGSPL